MPKPLNKVGRLNSDVNNRQENEKQMSGKVPAETMEQQLREYQAERKEKIENAKSGKPQTSLEEIRAKRLQAMEQAACGNTGDEQLAQSNAVYQAPALKQLPEEIQKNGGPPLVKGGGASTAIQPPMPEFNPPPSINRPKQFERQKAQVESFSTTIPSQRKRAVQFEPDLEPAYPSDEEDSGMDEEIGMDEELGDDNDEEDDDFDGYQLDRFTNKSKEFTDTSIGSNLLNDSKLPIIVALVFIVLASEQIINLFISLPAPFDLPIVSLLVRGTLAGSIVFAVNRFL